jgi:hypothetical protein
MQIFGADGVQSQRISIAAAPVLDAARGPS